MSDMTEGVIITKEGLVEKRWNSDLRSTHKIRRNKDDTFSVITKDTKKEVLRTPTRDETEEFFQECKPVDFTWNHLRKGIEIESDVTLHDVFDMMERYDCLRCLIPYLFPSHSVAEKSPQRTEDAAVVGWYGFVKNRELNIGPNRQGFLSHNFPEALITIDEHLIIKNLDGDGTDVCEGDLYFSLLDFFLGLFGQDPTDSGTTVTLRKEGLFDEEGAWIVDPMEALLHPCEIDEEIVFGDILHFVEQHEMLTRFISAYSRCHAIDKFHEDAKKPRKPSDDEEGDLWYLEVYQSGDIHRYTWEGGEKEVNFTFVADFHGIGEATEDEKKLHPDTPGGVIKTNYSVSCTRMYDMAHLPIFLSRGLRIVEWRSDLRKEVQHLRCRKPLTLLDVLDAIYWDISFHGGPDENDTFIESMNEKVTEIRHALDEGEVKTYNTVEELMNDLMDEEVEE